MNETNSASQNATSSSTQEHHPHGSASDLAGVEDEDEPPSPSIRERVSQVTGVDGEMNHITTPSSNELRNSERVPLSEKQVPPALKRGGLGVAMPFLSRSNAEASESKQNIDIEKLDDATIETVKPVDILKASSPILARLRLLFTPAHPLTGPPPTYAQSLRAIITYSPLNVLLIFIPIAWGMHFAHAGLSPTMIFVFSALGIIPLAALLGLGTEQIALRTSMSVGGLLNATLGNVVEMIIAGIALKKCELELVQSSLLGGLLSNLLLVLGMAFIVGGYRFHQQEFQPMVAQLNSTLMVAAVIALIVPAAFHGLLENRLAPGTEVDIMLQLSRGSAIILILVYIAYLVFQFYSHNHLFLDTSTQLIPLTPSLTRTSSVSTDSLTRAPSSGSSQSPTYSPAATHSEVLKLNTPSSLALLFLTTVLAYITCEALVSSLDGLVASHPSISKEFLTLIIIPIISNAAEHATAVVVASKGKFDLAMSVAVGSCIQIALLVVPVMVLVGWGMGRPLLMSFETVEVVVLAGAVWLVKGTVEGGRSHWLNGVVLVAVYVIIALAFWFFPDGERLVQGVSLVCPM